MSPKSDARLFEPDDLLTFDELKADAAGALAPGELERDRDLDAARMWKSRADGLLLRGVKPHSAEKSSLVSRGIETVSTAMSGKWFTQSHGLEYLELYSGPGRLLNERTGIEQVGSPLQALTVPKPFTRYVFSDYAQECVDALTARIGPRDDVVVLRGDANDQTHLGSVTRLLNEKALVIAYLDPARPQDLHWSTVAVLAGHFDFLDLIINLPVNSLMRAIQGAYAGGGSGPGAAGRFLNHQNPRQLLVPNADAPNTNLTIAAIREHYDQQLIGLGFKKPARRTVCFPADNPYYDILLASRHPTGLDLWNKTNPVPEDPQLSFLDGTSDP